MAEFGNLVRRLATRRARYLLVGLALGAVCLSAAAAMLGGRTGPKHVRSGRAAKAEVAKHAVSSRNAPSAPAPRNAKPLRIASQAAASPADAGPATEYANDLEAQLAQIGSEVRDQLTRDKGVEPERAEDAVARFTDSLRGVLAEPLTGEQLEAILGSLHQRNFWLIAPYRDITDLEVRLYTLVWTDFIKLYVHRRPMTPGEKDLLTRQVDSLIAAAHNAMALSLNGRSESSEIPYLLGYLSRLLYRELNDPVLPVTKRPFTQAEMDELTSWVARKISEGMTQWYASPAYTPGHASIPIGSNMTNLWVRIWRMQYAAPSLGPELTRQMNAERRALIMERARRFDQLPPAEQERAYQEDREYWRRLEAEGR
jgi:hypothetical protein